MSTFQNNDRLLNFKNSLRIAYKIYTNVCSKNKTVILQINLLNYKKKKKKLQYL